jgi:3-phosphoshikimate 1-carboxyvinyltransferase
VSLRSQYRSGFQFQPELPGDKSITHRAFILGALARGETRITGANPGADCAATLAAVETLGAEVTREPTGLRIVGTGGRFRAPEAPLDLGNSGTGLRLLLGTLAAQLFPVRLTGDASLCRRPVERVLGPLRSMGATATAENDRPPVLLTGGPLTGVPHRLAVPSAQVKSALLLAGLQAHGETWIGGVEGTRDHTERLLTLFGHPVTSGADWVAIQGPGALQGTAFTVPGDLSAGTFYLVAAAIRPGSQITLEGIGLNPTRTRVLQVLQRMGLELEIEIPSDEDAEPRGRVRAHGKTLRPVMIGPDEVPLLIDELPALAVAAAFAGGHSRIHGAGELRVKESNRLEAMAEGLRALGARITLEADGWTIEGSGGEALPGGRFASRGDHRVAMALLVAGLGCRAGAELLDEPLIETSDPLFPRNLERMGAA